MIHPDDDLTRLWLEVLALAQKDLCAGGKRALDAWAWIHHRDFELVCGLAGLDPDITREALKRAR